MFYFVFYHQGSKEITVNSLIASPDSIPMNPLFISQLHIAVLNERARVLIWRVICYVLLTWRVICYALIVQLLTSVVIQVQTDAMNAFKWLFTNRCHGCFQVVVYKLMPWMLSSGCLRTDAMDDFKWLFTNWCHGCFQVVVNKLILWKLSSGCLQTDAMDAFKWLLTNWCHGCFQVVVNKLMPWMLSRDCYSVCYHYNAC